MEIRLIWLLKIEFLESLWCQLKCLFTDMFDKDQSGTIDLQEFQQLWKFIQEWRAIFSQYDRGSGKLGQNELQSGKY